MAIVQAGNNKRVSIIISWIIFAILIFCTVLMIVQENTYEYTSLSTDLFAWNLDRIFVDSLGLIPFGFLVSNFYKIKQMFQVLHRYERDLHFLPTKFSVQDILAGMYIGIL